MRRFSKTLFATAVIFSATTSIGRAATILSEGFNDISTLAGAGWLLINDSTPIGGIPQGWFQGNNGIFDAHSGSPESYIAANFNSTDAGGTLAVWLVTPTFSTASAGSVTFWAQSAVDGYTDYISYGFGPSSGNTAAFTMSAPTIVAGGWNQYTVNFSAGGAGSTARFAIEYLGPEPTSNYIGIDTLSIQTDVSEVPGPVVGAGLPGLVTAFLGFFAWRRQRVVAA